MSDASEVLPSESFSASGIVNAAVPSSFISGEFLDSATVSVSVSGNSKSGADSVPAELGSLDACEVMSPVQRISVELTAR